MSEQTARECVFCHKPLTEQDDVVVCPECGAPYHRACYEQAGRCVFTEKHGAGFAYHAPGEAPGAQQGPSGAGAQGPAGAGAPAQADRSGLRPRVAECPASGYPYGADQEERGAAPPAAPRFFQGAVPAQKIKTAPKERCGSKNGFLVIGENWGNKNIHEFQ